MATTAERQRAFRKRLAAEGLKTVTVIVPEHAAWEVSCLAEALRDNPNLELVTLRDTRTGRFVKIGK